MLFWYYFPTNDNSKNIIIWEFSTIKLDNIKYNMKLLGFNNLKQPHILDSILIKRCYNYWIQTWSNCIENHIDCKMFSSVLAIKPENVLTRYNRIGLRSKLFDVIKPKSKSVIM